jgi:hypothetical protein
MTPEQRAAMFRTMLEKLVNEADADHWSEPDSRSVLVRRETIEAARKLLKPKSTRSTRRANQ